MLELLNLLAEHLSRWGLRVSLLLILFNVTARSAGAQDWSWSFEKVDSGAVNKLGSVHVSYTDSSSHVVKCAFRSAESSRWFRLVIEGKLGEATTRPALDPDANPHICYPDLMSLKYAFWNGERWVIQEISPGGTKEYTCSLAISSEGKPYVSWYQVRSANGTSYDHLRTAVLHDGAWLARTLDSEGEAGKWNSTVVDNQGRPSVSYSTFPTGELKLARLNGKAWQVSVIDSKARDSSRVIRGMGNCLRADAHGVLHVSYFSDKELRYAVPQGDRWLVQRVDDISSPGSWPGYLSSLGFDHAGKPHISYEDGSALKHAYWDGTRWHVQIVTSGGSNSYRYSSLGAGPDDTIYIRYRDSQDGSSNVAVGRSADRPPQAAVPGN